MSEARAKIWECLTRIYYDPKTCGEVIRWGGEQRRFQGRFAEFGLPDDYAVAVELVEIAISNRFAHHLPGHSAASTLRPVLDLIESCINPVSREIADPAAANLAIDSASNPVAWAACVQLVSDALISSREIPYSLRLWAAEVLRGERKQPDKRKKAGLFHGARNDAICFAVGLAMESGAFKGETHSKDKIADGTGSKNARARSACELVSFRCEGHVKLEYSQVATIWSSRSTP